jgi:hypothetical protein
MWILSEAPIGPGGQGHIQEDTAEGYFRMELVKVYFQNCRFCLVLPLGLEGTATIKSEEGYKLGTHGSLLFQNGRFCLGFLFGLEASPQSRGSCIGLSGWSS